MFYSITAIKRANKASGYRWFEPGAMRFFHTRIASGVVNGRYFITSEYQDDPSTARFAVRMAKDDGAIETIGKLQEHATKREAMHALYAHLLGRKANDGVSA